MKLRGTWSDPVFYEPEARPSPLFLRLAELNRLGDVVSRAAAIRSAAPSKELQDDKDEEPTEDVLGSWLFQLKADMEVEGFGKFFVCDTDCVALLLNALGVDTKPIAKALSDPHGVSVNVFTKLFASKNNRATVQALEKGTIDRMLLRLGELQAEKPRRPARAESFQLSHQKRNTESTSAGSADAVASTAISSLPLVDAPASDVSTGTSSTSLANSLTTSSATNALLNTMESKVLWKPGYGTGEAPASASKSDAERETMRLEKIKRTTAVAECLTAYLESIEEPETDSSPFWKDLLDCLEASCLLKVMLSSFFGVTCKAVVEAAALYTALLELVQAIARRRPLAPLVGELPSVYKSLCELMRYMKDLAQNDLADEEDETSKRLLKLIEETCALTDTAEAHRQQGQKQKEEEAATISEKEMISKDATEAEAEALAYEEAMRGEMFKDLDMRDPNTGKYSSHHFQSAIEDDAKDTGASKNRQRRLNRELKALRTTLPLHFGSTIVLRIDRTRPFVAQFIIFAPQNTPYDSGAFLFDVFCSTDYPNEPPKVNLQTTGQGRVRFNPNLYQNGKVCLSLLGTWRGGATGTENWSAENSSLYQVLVSIQSAILGSEFPYFNEPTVEALWGTEEGELQKRIHPNGGYERLRIATVQYAMTAQIRNPPLGFEQCVRTHFLFKRRYILSVCAKWIHEADSSNTVGHFQSLKEVVEELTVALKELGPTPREALTNEAPGLSQASIQKKDEHEEAKVQQDESPKQDTTAVMDQQPSSTTAFFKELKLSEAAIAGMAEQVQFIRAAYPDVPDAVLKELFVLTSKRDSNGEITAIDFTAVLEELAKLA